MNERQAMAEGLRYTGMTCSRYDDKRRKEYQAKAKEVRAYGIRIVQVSNSGGWTDWYAEDDYFKYRDAGRCEQVLANADTRREEARYSYNRRLAEIDEDVGEANETLDYLKAKYGRLPAAK